MKKFLIIITALLLCGAGYLTYDKWVRHARLTVWSFVPADAAITWETRLVSDLELIQSTPLWQSYQSTPLLKNLNKGLLFLDSINGEGGFSSIFQDVPAIISLHKVSNSSLDVLYVVDIQNLSQNTFVSAAIGRLKKAGYRFRTRNYNGFKISEVGDGEASLTYIFYKNFFLASFTPYLVEDAIRTIDNPDLPSFKEKYKKNLGGDIHINYGELANVLEAFTRLPVDLPLVSGSYEMLIDSAFIALSGLSQPKEWLTNHNAVARPFEMAEVVPTNTAVLYHFTSTNVPDWKQQQLASMKKNQEIAALNDSLSSTLDYDAGQIYDLLDDELGLAFIESARPDDQTKLLMLKVTDIGEANAYFRQVSERSAYARGDSLYSESYSESEIRFFPIARFPETLLGEIAKGFDQCFYTNYRNYLIFSNNLQELKTLVTANSDEDTWGKSVQMNDFLSRTNQEANVSVFVNAPRAWTIISKNFRPEWESHFREYEKVYRSVEMMAFQYSWIDGQYYTNYTFLQPKRQSIVIPKGRADNAITFTAPLICKPHLVRSHAHSNFDLIVQDQSNVLYFLDASFSTRWSVKLDAPIVSEVFEIDYYRNNKLQYALATENQVYIIDRTGAMIPGYPKSVQGKRTIEHLRLIDYDRSRSYRIAITDSEGSVYLTNKELNLLEGWDPIPYRRPAIQPLEHARLGGRDIMISIQRNGLINITNRRGERIKGFPFDTRSELSRNYFLSKSNSLATSSLNLMTQGGELLELNLEGKVMNRDQLIKNSPNTTFELIPDRLEKSFIIIRKEGNAYDVLDAAGNLLFSKDYLSQADILIQYYQFGAGKDLILFTDTANESLYIYDRLGNLVTGTPLKSSHEVGILYSSSKKELQVYTTSGSSLEYYAIAY